MGGIKNRGTQVHQDKTKYKRGRMKDSWQNEINTTDDPLIQWEQQVNKVLDTFQEVVKKQDVLMLEVAELKKKHEATRQDMFTLYKIVTAGPKAKVKDVMGITDLPNYDERLPEQWIQTKENK